MSCNFNNTHVYIGNRYVPKYEGTWSNENYYESLSIVYHNGNSYTSKKNVPEGVEITDTDYWVLTGSGNEDLTDILNRISSLENNIDGGVF